MQRIEASTTMIGRIVKVIDKTAFLAELLALNAAIDAMHHTVDGLDDATQQNAAMAERSAASAAAGSEQMDRLSGLVTMFRTAKTASGGTGRARAA